MLKKNLPFLGFRHHNQARNSKRQISRPPPFSLCLKRKFVKYLNFKKPLFPGGRWEVIYCRRNVMGVSGGWRKGGRRTSSWSEIGVRRCPTAEKRSQSAETHLWSLVQQRNTSQAFLSGGLTNIREIRTPELQRFRKGHSKSGFERKIKFK